MRHGIRRAEPSQARKSRRRAMKRRIKAEAGKGLPNIPAEEEEVVSSGQDEVTKAAGYTNFKPVTLPYFRDNFKGKIPTQTEIISRTPDYHDQKKCHAIVIFDNDFVAKYGSGARESEAQTLLFIEQYLEISAPLLYAMWRDGEHFFMVMQKMPGQTLRSVWQSLSFDQRRSVFSQLGTQVQAMRELKPLSPFFCGSIDGGPVPYFDIYYSHSGGTQPGPFSQRVDFNYTICLVMSGVGRIGYGNKHIESASQTLAKHLADSGSVFTHGGLHTKNIMVSKDGTKLKVHIIDWESSGWMPQAFEWITTHGLHLCTESESFLPLTLQEYRTQEAGFRQVEVLMQELKQHREDGFSLKTF